MQGLYFEQFTVGQTVESVGRTITESDIVTFAGLSGDYNSIHTDAEYAKTTPFGQRIAHGLLIQAIASGLAIRTGVLEGTVVAFRELSCKFSTPVFIGDTIRVTMTVSNKKELRRMNAGSVRIKFRVINQKDDVVQRGDWLFIVALAPDDIKTSQEA